MKSKNVPLIVGICIPVAMIIFVAASIYLPGIFIKPHHNFLYTTGYNDYYGCQWRYEVHNGTMTKVQDQLPKGQTYSNSDDCNPQWYVYNVQTDQNESVTFDQVQAMKLDMSAVSDDGFQVIQGYSGGGDFFFFPFYGGGEGDYGTYLKGNNVSKKITVKQSGSTYYSTRFTFQGWIL